MESKDKEQQRVLQEYIDSCNRLQEVSNKLRDYTDPDLISRSRAIEELEGMRGDSHKATEAAINFSNGRTTGINEAIERLRQLK